MGEMTHGAMLIGAFACMACTLMGSRRARTLDVVSSAAMLGAMADMAFTRLVPALVWTLILVAVGMALGARIRATRARVHFDRRGHDHNATRELHRALVFVVGGWLLVGTDGVSTSPEMLDVSTHVHLSSSDFPLAAATGVVILGGWLFWRLLSPGRCETLHATETASITLMLAAMTVPAILGT
ncbi:hypothetical protein [Mycetocola sp.]|uniref:hypothetical protein n=1 Tax=Mycetocola sp. TaxID=1871042 RepID=UPI00398A213C